MRGGIRDDAARPRLVCGPRRNRSCAVGGSASRTARRNCYEFRRRSFRRYRPLTLLSQTMEEAPCPTIGDNGPCFATRSGCSLFHGAWVLLRTPLILLPSPRRPYASIFSKDRFFHEAPVRFD